MLKKLHARTILHIKYNIAIVRVLVKMCQACNTTIFISAVFIVSLSLTHSVKRSVFYINLYILVRYCIDRQFRTKANFIATFSQNSKPPCMHKLGD